MLELLDAAHALASRGGGTTRRWLTESGLETPAPVSLVDLVARRASPAPSASVWPHDEAAGEARHGLRRRARRPRRGGEGVSGARGDGGRRINAVRCAGDSGRRRR